MKANQAAYLRRIIRELLCAAECQTTSCLPHYDPSSARTSRRNFRIAKRRVNEFIYTLTEKEPQNG
jgi:hypothetical protein